MAEDDPWLLDGEELDTTLAADVAYYRALALSTDSSEEGARFNAIAGAIQKIRTDYLGTGRFNHPIAP